MSLMNGLDLRFAHMGVAVSDLPRAEASFAELFGYQRTSGPFDDPIQKVTVCFLSAPGNNEPVIELIAPLGEDSPVKRLLAKGGGAYHLCYDTARIDETLRQAKEMGCVLVSAPVPAVAFGGRRIAWIYTPARQLVELVERG